MNVHLSGKSWNAWSSLGEPVIGPKTSVYALVLTARRLFAQAFSTLRLASMRHSHRIDRSGAAPTRAPGWHLGEVEVRTAHARFPRERYV